MSDLPAEKGQSKHVKHEFYEDYRVLQTILGRLEGTSDLRDLDPLLQELRQLLTGHFAREEAADGLHGVIGEAAPQNLGQLETLMKEHKEFLGAIKDLDERIHACLRGPVAEIQDAVLELCNRLHAHEAKETKLLTDSLYTDLGETS